MTWEHKVCVAMWVTRAKMALQDQQVNQEGMVLMALRETKDRVDDQEILALLAQLEFQALKDQLDQRDKRVFLVKGVLMVLMELSVQKVTTASRVTQAHVEPGACQEPTEYVVNAVNQAILALMVSLALLASKENRVQLVLWEKLAA